MALSLLGIQYICENFGDTSLCCVETGLTWYFITPTGDRLDETGGTSMIVSRFASGIAKTLTMVSPDRGTFTPEELDAANGSRVFLEDAKEIREHDEPTEVQWCFIPCSDHADQPTCELYGCFWWNGACHDLAPTCEELNNQPDCLLHGCFWYDGACHSAVVCESIITQTECEAHGCYWWNGSCHTGLPTCEELNNQPDCLLHGCFWYDGACHSAVVCESIITQIECEAHGCYWWNGACHTAAPSCEELNNEPDCSRYGCYWFRGVCHSVDQPELCYWIDDKGGPIALTVAQVVEIINSYIFSTPPSGWTFVPTVLHATGVVNYYLGFIAEGNTYTGCAFPE